MAIEASGDVVPGNTGGSGEGGGPSVADAIGRSGAVVGESADTDGEGKPRARPKGEGDKVDAVERYKLRINGAEVEHDGATLAKMLSDDHEHEFTGPGGKPWKGSRAEIERMVQKGLGYETKNRALAEREQRFEQQLELAKKDPKARMAFMMTHLGIEDPDEFVIQRYQELDHQRRQIAQLMTEGRGDEAYRLQQQIVQERMERADHLERVNHQRWQQDQQHQRATAEHQGKVRQAFEKAGVPFTRETYELAEAKHKHWAELAIPKTYDQIAAEVAKEQRTAFHGRLRGIPREKLLGELPDDWRRQLRELEAEAAKTTKKEERSRPAEEERPPRAEPKDDRVSEAEYARRQRRS